MSSTERLRAMLDERGVEWWNGHGDCDGHAGTLWDGIGGRWYAGGMTGVCGCRLYLETPADRSPEQAIAATLGSCSRSSNCTNGERTNGTCRDVRSADHTIAFECGECGCWVAYDEYWETGIYVLHADGQEHIHPRYCPSCGREVEQ